MFFYREIVIIVLLVVVIVLAQKLLALKKHIRRQNAGRDKKEGVLTTKGPHTVELLSGLHMYYMPVSRVQEFPEIKISVLVPSRSRPDLLQKSLSSLITLATEPEGIQIIVRCDLDDAEMTDFQFLECKNFKILRGDRMKGYASLHFFYTQCAMLASGTLFLLWNDDAQMLTPGWDKLLWSETAGSRDRKIPGFWALGNNHWPYAFPVITRQVTERLGAFARFAYNDAYLYQLALACGIEQRVLEKIRVQHDMPEKKGWDAQSFDLYNAGFFNDIIRADAELILSL
jgi:hypothetical protein